MTAEVNIPRFAEREGEPERVRKLNTFVNQLAPLLQILTELFSGYRKIDTFPANDATPSVANGRKIYKTANASATTITNFDDGVEGQEIIVIVGDANTTFDFTGTNLKGRASVDWTAAAGDHIRAFFDPPNWRCETFDNT